MNTNGFCLIVWANILRVCNGKSPFILQSEWQAKVSGIILGKLYGTKFPNRKLFIRKFTVGGLNLSDMID